MIPEIRRMRMGLAQLESELEQIVARAEQIAKENVALKERIKKLESELIKKGESDN